MGNGNMESLRGRRKKRKEKREKSNEEDLTHRTLVRRH
jgi:hypothetical protein